MSYLCIFDTEPRSASDMLTKAETSLRNIKPFHPVNPKCIILCVRVCVPGPAHLWLFFKSSQLVYIIAFLYLLTMLLNLCILKNAVLCAKIAAFVSCHNVFISWQP